MTEPHETFTWYDYPAERNRRIAIKRAVLTVLFLIAVWSGVFLWVM